MKPLCQRGVTSLVWSPDDQYIAVGDESGGVRVFSIEIKINIQTEINLPPSPYTISISINYCLSILL